jgi:hypothetical protein
MSDTHKVHDVLFSVGYSWKSNQYGLTVDSITAYELVKPDGNVVKVTEASDSELFFGLKVVLFPQTSGLIVDNGASRAA